MPKLLFIGPRFYNYHETIKKGFEDAGYDVVYFDDRPSTSFLTKALVRLNKNLIKGKIRKYFNSIKEAVIAEHFDVVFVLYGQSFSVDMMRELKEASPNSYFVFYMFDPISSMPDRVQMAEIFDDCYSFDYADCQNYSGFKLIPLFYSFKEFEPAEQKYDACAVVTMMPGKYTQIKTMVGQLEEHGFNVYKMYFLQSKLVWLYYKLTKKEFRKSKMNEFSYQRIDMKTANELITQSKYIIDCPKEGQTGLTIRSFESLAAGKKFITTNNTIDKYDFFKPENDYVFSGTFDFESVFFNSEYSPVDDSIKQKYSINNWVNQILQNCRRSDC